MFRCTLNNPITRDLHCQAGRQEGCLEVSYVLQKQLQSRTWHQGLSRRTLQRHERHRTSKARATTEYQRGHSSVFCYLTVSGCVVSALCREDLRWVKEQGSPLYRHHPPSKHRINTCKNLLQACVIRIQWVSKWTTDDQTDKGMDDLWTHLAASDTETCHPPKSWEEAAQKAIMVECTS